MSHTVSGQTTNYAWDAGAKLPVVLQDGTNTYVYGLDLISATDSSGAQTYFLADGLGSTTDLLDGSANVTASYRYDVFGAIRSQTGSSPNQWLFTGEQRDSDSSMYYLRARYYDPAIGRFLSQDPAGAGHPYAYGENNPATFVDPYGLHICDAAGLLGHAAEEKCRQAADKLEAGANAVGGLAEQGAETIANAAESCWNSRICRTVVVEAGVLGCSIATSPTGWGPYACAAGGALLLSYEEAVDCVQGSTISCANVGANVGISVATAGAGHIFGRTVANRFRIAIDPAGGHSFPGRGQPAHFQFNWWIKGGDADQWLNKVWRHPLPDSWPEWLHFDIRFR